MLEQPSWVSSALSAPYSALSIQRHISAFTMVGSAQGRMMIVRSNHRPRNGWSMSSASASPNAELEHVETTVKHEGPPDGRPEAVAGQLIDVVAESDERLDAGPDETDVEQAHPGRSNERHDHDQEDHQRGGGDERGRHPGLGPVPGPHHCGVARTVAFTTTAA